MLDDLKLIHERDPDDTLGIAERQWQQLAQEFSVSIDGNGIENVVYSGMGGSALAALVSGTWPGYNVPFELVRGYDAPAYVSEKTLFIASSYSGNTEETLSSLEQAKQKGARICIIAGGGKLSEIAAAENYPLAVIPKAEQPRYAVLSNLKALVSILASAGLIDGDSVFDELRRASDFLESVSKRWQATVPTEHNHAKQLANEAAGKSVVIYGGPKMASAAYKWKISFNENAKQVAWWNQYSEFNHNEFMGWAEQPPIKPYLVVDIRSSFEGERILKRFELSAKLLSGKRPEPMIVITEGDTLIEHLLYAIMLGDFTSIYSAILSGVSPAPVELIEKFKVELNQ